MALLCGFTLARAPLAPATTKLTVGDGSSSGYLGFSAALSADGNTALVGSFFDDDYTGAAWVFTRSGTSWTQGPKLTASDVVGPGQFGTSVALSANGDMALIGGPNDDGQAGAAWVFTRSGSTWTQQGAKLTAEDANGGMFGVVSFGRSVALSADGATALIGGQSDNAAAGAAWAFTRDGTIWTQQGPKLTSGTSGQSAFGASVALSADGDTALIGGPLDHSYLGAAWAFTRSGTTWSHDGPKLVPVDPADGADPVSFGSSVELDGTGQTALVSGYNENANAGAVWVFDRSGGSWTQQGPKLVSEQSGQAYFGNDTALSADGDTALIGAPLTDGFAGAAWLFTRSGSTWSQDSKLTADDESGDAQLGVAVALSSDGGTALVTGPYDAANAGAAWVFASALAPVLTAVQPRSGLTTGGTVVTITGTDLAGATAVHFGSVNATSFTVDSPTSITAVAPASPAGTVDVTVTTPAGTSPTGSADLFTFVTPGPAPVVRRVAPRTGPAAGGTTVTITGTGFAGVTDVRFGSADAASFTVTSTRSITAVSPTGAAGTVDVTVTTPNGTSATGAGDRFTLGPPTVTGISPPSGTRAGGTSVTITGTGFAPGPTGTVFRFGATAAPSVACISTTSCVVTTPPSRRARTVDVIATVSGMRSATDPAARFAYL